MNNDIITVTSPLLPDLGEFNAMLQDIWSRKWITNMGHYHQELEAALAKYLGVEYISLFTNGTLPLITALQALGITEGEVITTPYSFVATSHSIWWNKLKPVFVDIDENSCGMDPAKIEAAITDKTVAIMPVHCYGCPCDVEAIDAIAKRHNLKVIYDAAHAFGVKVKAPKPPKGGVLGSSDPILYERLEEFAKENRNHPTQAEEILWSILSRTREDRAPQPPKKGGVCLGGYKFRRQHVIGQYIADFVCLEKMLIIELDGKYHSLPDQMVDDVARTNYLNRLGYQVLRFTNEEILCDTDNALAKISDALQRPLQGDGGLVSILEYGDLSTLSFHATKVFNTVEGGALVCHSKEMKEKIDHLKNFGFEDETTVVAPGINSKMDEMRAAYGLLNLRQVDAAIAARKHVAEQYVAALKDVKGIKLFPYEIEQVGLYDKKETDEKLGFEIGEEESRRPNDQGSVHVASRFGRWNFAYFPILVDDSFPTPPPGGRGAGALSSRDALYEHMKSQGVLGRRYFYPLITDFEPYKDYPSAAPANLPIARRLADQVICLPMHHALSEEDVQRVLECIKFF